MAMLAEKRQKTRWILNPRQTKWSSDSTKFGQRCLEKMGWTSGQGLGANLQGSTDHVKVTVRSDNRGVGFKDVPEDVLTHQNNYADLLAQLGTGDLHAMPECSDGKSLEVKSQKSRARVHYHKFTRGKDLSRYSQKDLECILGKSAKQNVPAEVSLPIEPNTIHRGDMNEYFKQKMKSSLAFSSFDANKSDNDGTMQCLGFGFTQDTENISFSDVRNSGYKSEETLEINAECKKPRKNENCEVREDASTEVGQPCNITNGDLSESESYQVVKKKKKKKEHTNLPVEEDLSKNECCLPVVTCTEKGKKRKNDNDADAEKQSRKRRKNNDGLCAEVIDEDCLAVTEYNEKLEKEHNKTKKPKNDGHIVQEVAIEDCLDLCSEELQVNEQSNIEMNDGVRSIKRSRKKHKKDIYLSAEVPNSEDSSMMTNGNDILGLEQNNSIEENGYACSIKKSKKKRKRDICQNVEVPNSEVSLTVTNCNKMLELEQHNNSFVNDDANSIKRSKKKRKKETGQSDEAPNCEDSSTVANCNEMLELDKSSNIEVNDDANPIKSKKKRKKETGQSDEVPNCEDSSTVVNCNEMQELDKSINIEVNDDAKSIKRSKKKRKKETGQSDEAPNCEDSSTVANCKEMQELNKSINIDVNDDANSIKRSKKKRKKHTGQNDKLLENEDCSTLANNSDKLEVIQNTSIDMTEGILCNGKSSRKGEKNIQAFTEVPHFNASLPLTDNNEILLSKWGENIAISQEVHDDLQEKKRKKKKRDFKKDDSQNNDYSTSTCENLEGNEKESNSDSTKIEDEANPTKLINMKKILKYDKHEQVDKQRRKSVTFSEELLNVVLIPSREQLLVESVRASGDDISCLDDSNTDKKDIPINTEIKIKKPPPGLGCATTNSVGLQPKGTVTANPSLIVINGVKYFNGISEYAQKLTSKRIRYDPDASKGIPYWMRKEIRAEFPGANVMMMGYGIVGQSPA